MHEAYADITSRLGDPLWWDEAAVPRYDPFHPSLCANIYARQAALVVIRCQSCRRRFQVAFSWSAFDRAQGISPLSKRIEAKTLSYGDPPNISCCASGATMTSDTDRVLQFWRRDGIMQWMRAASHEVDLEED